MATTFVTQCLCDAFLNAGIRPGGVLLLHSSLSSLGPVLGGADTVIDALLLALGPSGTLCIPTLSYLFSTETLPVFNVLTTPSNVGAISNAFLCRPGVIRSVHPTHSVAAIGHLAHAITKDHLQDRTPVGENSPFRRIKDFGGQIAFLGCGTRCNTSIHGVEECLLPAPPPYLFNAADVMYSVTDANGREEKVSHKRHNFMGTGQRYERLVNMVTKGAYLQGIVQKALLEIFDAKIMWETALMVLLQDPLCLIESVVQGECHFLKQGTEKNNFSYTVGPTKIE